MNKVLILSCTADQENDFIKLIKALFPEADIVASRTKLDDRVEIADDSRLRVRPDQSEFTVSLTIL